MGCDIHLFVEYTTDNGRWLNLTKGEFEIPRDYQLFGALAGVRGGQPLHHPRGLPSDLTNDVFAVFYIPVREPGEDSPRERWGLHFEDRASIDDYVAKGLSHTVKRTNGDFVSDPDHHHHGWLSALEVKASVESAGLRVGELPVEFRIAMDALSRLDPSEDGTARIVFAFDN